MLYGLNQKECGISVRGMAVALYGEEHRHSLTANGKRIYQ